LGRQTKILIIAIILATIVIVAILANNLQNSPSPTPQPSETPSATSSPTATSSTSLPSLLPTPTVPPTSPSQTPITLYPGEIREYNGSNLSSISDVYENAISGTQHIDVATYHLSVNGLVNKTMKLSYEDVIGNHQLYQKAVTLYCVEGWSATILWEGVLVKDLIQEAEPNLNATTVIFHASDGYTTALPLNYLVKGNIILAYKMNNLTIPPERGFPFQLVAESKYGYKWIKWITGIELSNNTNYLGYWESRGYSNNANVS
jgi:DMSO/TMAO reductase YedYZ molybdopterin-dependent catalytic subunit